MHYAVSSSFKHHPIPDGLIVVSDGVDFLSPPGESGDLCRHLANLNDIPFELSDVEITLEQRLNLVRMTFDRRLINVI